jgi:hypothetical protein
MTGNHCGLPKYHDNNEIAVILMVTTMIEHRNNMIAKSLDRFEQGSDRLHQERRKRSLKQISEELISIADQIHELAQDNAYDVRNLLVHLYRHKMLHDSATWNTGNHSSVCYIQ